MIAAVGALALSSSAVAAPIPPIGVPTLPDSMGAPATAHPIAPAPRPEQNPFMAPNPSSNIQPGQADAGSGTTPTIMKGGYVAITDNAEQMDVVVYRTARKLRKVRSARSAGCRYSSRELAQPTTRCSVPAAP